MKGWRFLRWLIPIGIVLFVLVVRSSGERMVTQKRVSRPSYENQARNQPCFSDRDCQQGLTCEGAAVRSGSPQAAQPGTCQKLCTHDRDCGNEFLCKSGKCQKDCAGIGEKCSDRRLCCFMDTDQDGETNSACLDDGKGDVRCRL